MSDQIQVRVRVGEVVAHQVMPQGLKVFVVTDETGTLKVGDEIVFGDQPDAPPVRIDNLAHDSQPVRSIVGTAKVNFHLADHRIVPSGTPVLI